MHAHGQDAGKDPCADELEMAEQAYVNAAYNEAIALASDCLDRNDIASTTRVEANRLIGLAYLRRDMIEEARGAILNILAADPGYEPSPIEDPPLYRSLVTIVRRAAGVAREEQLMDAFRAREENLAQEEEAERGLFIDRVTVGVGAATYYGNLERRVSPTPGIWERSGADIFLNVERRFGPAFLALEGGFSYLRMRDSRGFSNRALRTELQTGVGIDWLTEDFIRFFTGFGMLYHRPILHDRDFVRDQGFQTSGVGSNQWSGSIPVGIEIGQRVRVMFRWLLDGSIDDARGEGTDIGSDFLIHVTVGQPFRFD